ncbi:monooxygenase, partial [Streptomyces sp. SID2119]|nr:monooxygenase [Streptomyces sp. SID2119]
RASAPRAGRVLLVGDAAGYTDALTGEGIALAVATATAAVGCLAAGRPEEYPARWTRTTRRYRLLTQALLGAAGHPVSRRMIVAAAHRAPALFRTAVRALQ